MGNRPGKNNPDALDSPKWRGQNLLGFTLMAVRKDMAILDMYGEFDEEKDGENMEETK